MKKYQVELCYSLYSTPVEVEADDERDAVEKVVLAINLTGGGPSLDMSGLSRWRGADMVNEIEEVKEDGSEKPDNPEGP